MEFCHSQIFMYEIYNPPTPQHNKILNFSKRFPKLPILRPDSDIRLQLSKCVHPASPYDAFDSYNLIMQVGGI